MSCQTIHFSHSLDLKLLEKIVLGSGKRNYRYQGPFSNHLAHLGAGNELWAADSPWSPRPPPTPARLVPSRCGSHPRPVLATFGGSGGGRIPAGLAGDECTLYYLHSCVATVDLAHQHHLGVHICSFISVHMHGRCKKMSSSMQLYVVSVVEVLSTFLIGIIASFTLPAQLLRHICYFFLLRLADYLWNWLGIFGDRPFWLFL